ncbi:MAG: L-seryl-tRNA(Sec) selenium transferase, partial [Nitrospirae bacterium]
MEEIKNLLRKLPQVDELLKDEAFREFRRAIALKAIRLAIDRTREALLKGQIRDFSKDDIVKEAIALARDLSMASLRRVINATGIVIHTNLGRAPLAEEALKAVVEVSKGYSNLEFDLSTGKRGKRYDHLKALLKDITGAEDVIVVNNNAAAVLLCLSAIARGKEVVVSRGELVEIGGAFRVPDVMLQSGAILKEVGTTNKTHLRDYEGAISEETALLLKVHRSNYRIIG